jgi:hypothetical protein
MGESLQAQVVRYYYGPTYQSRSGSNYQTRTYPGNYYYGNQPYSVQKPVYDSGYVNGSVNEIVTQTPQGPVRSTSTVNPYTGEQISTTYWRDPRTGLVTTSERVVNPVTGQEQASTRTVNPYTGTVQRSSVTGDPRLGTYSEQVSGVDPWSGTPYRSGSTYQYPYGSNTRVVVPYRP